MTRVTKGALISAALLAAVLCPETKDGKPVIKKGKDGKPDEPVLRPVEPDEVLDFVVRDGTVTVVTTQGRKYSGRVPKGYKDHADEEKKE